MGLLDVLISVGSAILMFVGVIGFFFILGHWTLRRRDRL